ncbi:MULTISPECIES: RHS repeat domain-containing protein [unclassified Pseudomonas]|uniref:RHS repeat domain-containing protein n=1 Tax=unclassified Pseudomonas TaxID=196821 RepID=UPI000C87E7B2|nr:MULTISPECIES: RHS repeat-associated core domain-containing protein [unclassified Pseudomonas]PMZ99414.1 hypothetical protein C1X79_07880 [Pseudomonas sp. FW305-42]PNA23197.1 hypothetical protein C1X78_14370 [Pseudomonas sp. MPR-R1B]PNB25799.1 hypothetical protein C1X80_12860 [Pseudomonas sp. DP16D-E2]PNB41795.1 hypothetical protein C1X75_18840 [Pseudomonas sp. FW305-17]PNB60790.1 hypothetical protein C1X77_13400 [Pseudomonas sp. GW531-E2]
MNAAPLLLGQQTYDGLGRQTSVDVAGRTTVYHYRPGLLPPIANTLSDGQRVAFTYEPQLGNVLLSTTSGDGPPECLHYHPQLARPLAADGALGILRWHFTPSGAVRADSWTVQGVEHGTQWRTSPGGKTLGFTDANGTEHQHLYDEAGRIVRVTVGQVSTTIAYDNLSRIHRETTYDPHNSRTLEKQLTYDTMGREATCTFTLNGDGKPQVFTQTLTYSALDQVTSRTWHDGKTQHEERFVYDARGRLVRYTTTSGSGPRDPFGNLIIEQRFILNALDGYRQVITTFSDGSKDIATFSYAAQDPCQVVAIDHSHPSWPARIDLNYDRQGRLVADSLGRVLTWDAQGRLQRVEYAGKSCEYRYSPDGRLRDRVIDGTLHRSFFSASQLTHEQQGDARLEIVGDGHSLFGLSKVAAGVRQTTLLGCDSQGSVRLESDDTTRPLRYGPHGTEHDNTSLQPFGYAGERREPLTGCYMAAGYRPYDPVLMCFLAPDSESPFGRGGLNAYAYCGADPVNRVDPDGHSWQAWVLGSAGLLLGAATTVASLGSAAPAIATLLAGGLGALSANSALAISSAALSAMSLGSGAAAIAMQAGGANEKAVSALGWLSLGTGIAAAVVGMVPKIARLATDLYNASGRAASKVSQFKPYHVGPGGNTRPASVIFGTGKRAEDVAFVPSLFGEGNAALVTHGHPLGMLMNGQGLADDAVNVARDLIAPRLAQMNYPEGQKLVLLACWGGKSGAAQKIANALNRPVEAYGEKLLLKNLASLQSSRSTGLAFRGNNLPLYKPSPWERLTSKADFMDSSKYRIARPKLYTPQ